MRKTAAVIAVLSAAFFAAPAAAQLVEFVTTGTPGAPDVLIELPVRVSGTLSVDFHGSEAAGCAALGRCAFSGTEVFDPGRAGVMDVASLRVHGKRKLVGSLVLDGGEPTVAQTKRSAASGPGGSCSDLSGDGTAFDDLTNNPVNSLSVRVGESVSAPLFADVFATRCPGPLGSDLRRFIPVRRLSRAVIRHGGKLDLSATKPFAAAGFAGTLRSTIVLRFGKPHRSSLGSDTGGGHGRRLRELVVRYNVERVSGSVGLTFTGLGDPAQCLGLDACGTSGTISESPAGTRGTLDLVLLTRAARPRRDARTLLGLAKGGRTSGLAASGFGVWFGHALVQSSVSHNDGGPPCTDTGRLRAGALAGSVRHSHVWLQYGPYSDDSLRTRCGGPLESDLVAGRALASGEVPVSALRHKTLTVHLKRPPAVVPTTGYSGSLQADITITLRRTAVREDVLRGL